MSYSTPMNAHSGLPFSLEDSQTFIDLGWQLLYQDGRFEDAEKALQSALELDPGNVKLCWNWRIVMVFRTGSRMSFGR